MVTVANGTLLDREAAASHTVTVRATSSDGSFSTQTFTVNVNDVDEFDAGPVSDTNAAANTVNENAANGTRVGITAFASDADATTNTITYSLDSSAGGRFAINATTGVVTVANGTLLDREAAASHNITVRATEAVTEFMRSAGDGEHDIPRQFIQPFEIPRAALECPMPTKSLGRTSLNTVQCPHCGRGETRLRRWFRGNDTVWWCDMCVRPVPTLRLVAS